MRLNESAILAIAIPVPYACAFSPFSVLVLVSVLFLTLHFFVFRVSFAPCIYCVYTVYIYINALTHY